MAFTAILPHRPMARVDMTQHPYEVPIGVQVVGGTITWYIYTRKNKTSQAFRDEIYLAAALGHLKVPAHCEKYYRGSDSLHIKKMHRTETAELLAEETRDLNTLLNMNEEDLLKVEGIGDKTAKAIAEFFEDKENQEEIKLLLKYGVHPQKMKEKMSGHRFSGKTFVLTGTLSHYTRDEATALIKERGGHVAGSVSKNTDYVLVGEEPGSKYEKAKKLNIAILSEEQFRKMV
jgi:hypothetical protein